MYKQAILVRMDLKMPKGKLAAQVAHAAVSAVKDSNDFKLGEWESNGSKKVVLKVKDKKELLSYIRNAKKNGLVTSLIKDAGHTFFKLPTITCGAIGPDEEDKIDEVVDELGLL
jgi:PTH2 family peptidyl-tRNA hydrolase